MNACALCSYPPTECSQRHDALGGYKYACLPPPSKMRLSSSSSSSSNSEQTYPPVNQSSQSKMPSLSQTLLLAAAAFSVTSAAPVEEQKGHSFTVHQVRNPKHVKNGALALAKAYRKYGAAFPEYLTSALNTTYAGAVAKKRASTGSAVTTPEEYDVEYLTPVSIGTPAQTLNLDFDTGSADLWVFSSELASKYQTGHSVYKPASSSTSKKLSGYTWDISYGDGSGASGDVYTDVVSIGGVSFATQAVEAASTISTEFTEDTDNDGLVGLSFSSINTVSPKSQKTFFDNVKSSLTSPLFAANLKHGAGKPFLSPTRYSFRETYI